MTGCARVIAAITGLGHAFTTGHGLIRALVEILYRVAIACCDVVFFQNSEDRELFIKCGLVNAAKTRLVAGSGVDLERFQPAEKEQRRQNLCFLMIGRLLKEKGVFEYAEAATLLKQKYPYVSFGILGERDIRNPSVVPEATLNKWTENGILKWHGWVVDVRPYIEKADVIVLPSYREGTPRALLEAGAMGKPLVTTNTIGCREVVHDGDNGFLVPVGSAESLASAMEKFVLEENLVAQMGIRARQYVSDHFDEKDVISQTIEQYS